MGLPSIPKFDEKKSDMSIIQIRKVQVTGGFPYESANLGLIMGT